VIQSYIFVYLKTFHKLSDVKISIVARLNDILFNIHKDKMDYLYNVSVYCSIKN